MPGSQRNSAEGRPEGRPEQGPKVDIRDLVEYMTKALVDQADDVEVTLVEERDANVYEIEVEDDDLGKIIGRGGKTARALRTIVGAVAPRRGKRTMVEILE